MLGDIIKKINKVTGVDFSACDLSVEVMRPDRESLIMLMTGKNTHGCESKKTVKYRYKSVRKSKSSVVMIYSFEDLEGVTAFAKNNLYYCLLFDGKNSLYIKSGKAILVVNVAGALREFLPAFNDRVCEYADISVCSEVCSCYIEEYEKPILRNCALKTIYYNL